MDIKLHNFIISNSKNAEQWKEIEGTNGKYYISSCGRVISYCAENPCFLSLCEDTTNGYYRISIIINGQHEKPYIHRLVAQYFIEQRQSEKRLVVHHKNQKKTDNRAENLVYLTDEEHNKIHHGKAKAAANGKE